MCNGHSTRITKGGTIAVLRPPHNFIRAETDVKCDLLFHKTTVDSSKTLVTLQASHAQYLQALTGRERKVLIHADGDLTKPFVPETTDVITVFSIGPSTLQESRADCVVMLVDANLGLHVGDDGVIGRRVSIVPMKVEGNRTIGSIEGWPRIADGIVGWN